MMSQPTPSPYDYLQADDDVVVSADEAEEEFDLPGFQSAPKSAPTPAPVLATQAKSSAGDIIEPDESDITPSVRAAVNKAADIMRNIRDK